MFCFCVTISPSICASLLIADYVITNFIDCFVQDGDLLKSLWLMLQDCFCVISLHDWIYLQYMASETITEERKQERIYAALVTWSRVAAESKLRLSGPILGLLPCGKTPMSLNSDYQTTGWEPSLSCEISWMDWVTMHIFYVSQGQKRNTFSNNSKLNNESIKIPIPWKSVLY